ncbi:MAG: D-alanine--D-alanine ligase [Lentisphaerae bacterium]|nr:D-alanine--D-alanine ligase [Lentisphaerota bacterium]
MGGFRNVAVLLGGPSAEREVSLRSGAAVVQGLREAGYRARPVDVRDEAFDLPPDCEAVFIALHGAFGEDGRAQALLDARQIPYTGSGAAASRAAFDKAATKRILDAHGIRTPAYEILRNGAARRLPLPVVVKPTRQGSTIGVHRVRRAGDEAAAVRDAFTYGPEVLVERYIAGRELTVGIVGGTALPVLEIVAPEGWYDYGAKYTAGRTAYKVPAPLDDRTAQTCREMALRTFRALNCRGFARVDFRLGEDGCPYVLELNTIPGFTETSLLPKAAAAAGIAFAPLCGRIMELAAYGGVAAAGGGGERGTDVV